MSAPTQTRGRLARIDSLLAEAAEPRLPTAWRVHRALSALACNTEALRPYFAAEVRERIESFRSADSWRVLPLAGAALLRIEVDLECRAAEAYRDSTPEEAAPELGAWLGPALLAALDGVQPTAEPLGPAALARALRGAS